MVLTRRFDAGFRDRSRCSGMMARTGALVAVGGGGASRAAQDRSADAQQPPIQARPGGPESSPKTDQTIDVTKGTRLVLSNNAGEVVVRSWDRDQVRVQAIAQRSREGRRRRPPTRRCGFAAARARGPSSLVDYQITVPRWMPVNLSGTYLEGDHRGHDRGSDRRDRARQRPRRRRHRRHRRLRSVEGIITVDKAAGKRAGDDRQRRHPARRTSPAT